MILSTTSLFLSLASWVISSPVVIRQDDPSNNTAQSIFKPETLAAVEAATTALGINGGIIAYTSPKGDGVLTFGNRSAAGDPVTPDTHFAIASNSKLFLGTALVWISQRNLTLDNGNVWSLDTPLKDFVPGFKMVDPNATEQATTLDFLSHRTGLPPHNFAINPNDTPKIWMERLAYLRPNTPFRSNFTYSNLNYAAITYVVELVTKRTYYDLLAEYIFKPLEMQASSNYTALVDSGAQVSEGWMRQGVNYTQCLEDLSKADSTTMVLPPGCAGTPEAIKFWTQGSGQEWGGGGNVIATGNDLVKWTTEILYPTVIRQAVFDRVETVTYPGTAAPDQGYAIGTVQATYRGYNISTHDGALPGSNSNFIRVRNESVGVFSLSTDDTYASAWYGVVQYLILDDLLGLAPVNTTEGDAGTSTESSDLASLIPVYTLPPADARPSPDRSTYVGSTFLAPGYAPFTLSTLDLTDKEATSAALFPADFLLTDVATLLNLSFEKEILYAAWNQTVAKHVVFTHFDGPIYNVTVLGSWARVGADGVVGKYWGSSNAVFTEGGIAFFNGFWSQGGTQGVAPIIEENVEEAAEVFFAKQ